MCVSHEDFIQMSDGRDPNNNSVDGPHVKFGLKEMKKVGVETRVETGTGPDRTLTEVRTDYDTS